MAVLMTMEESMINEECKAEVIEFLKTHKSPSVCTATTIKDGFVSCIKPIPTICGAELICSPRTREHVLRIVREHS